MSNRVWDFDFPLYLFCATAFAPSLDLHMIYFSFYYIGSSYLDYLDLDIDSLIYSAYNLSRFSIDLF